VHGSGNSVLLQPEKWQGKKLPILGHIQNSYPMRSGTWKVVLYEPDCEKCEVKIEQLNKQSSEKVAFISLKDSIFRSEGNRMWTSLTNEVRWFAKVPAVIDIENSAVLFVDQN
jgi:hypothetical protein